MASSDTLDLRFIEPGHPLYAQELELRFRVLREPLGHTRADVPFPFEAQSLHLLAVDAEEVVGCVLFHPEEEHSGRLFQMAVAPSRQGQGVGRQLVRALEASLMARGVRHVHLHAREPVVPFYESLGYATYGDPFVEVGIAHRHMERTLT